MTEAIQILFVFVMMVAFFTALSHYTGDDDDLI